MLESRIRVSCFSSNSLSCFFSNHHEFIYDFRIHTMAFTQGWTLLDTQGRTLKATAYYSYSCIILPGQFLRFSSIVFPDLSCLIQTTLIISKVFEIHAAVTGQFCPRITSIWLFPVGHIRSIYHIKGGIFWHCCMGFLNLVCLMQGAMKPSRHDSFSQIY